MEYRRRSLWNRVWENDSLDSLSQAEYQRYVYEGESHPWREICQGIVMSLWKGLVWAVMGGKN